MQLASKGWLRVAALVAVVVVVVVAVEYGWVDALYVASMLLEVGGVLLVLHELALDRAAVRLLTEESEPVEQDENTIARSPGGSMAMRRHLYRLASDSTATGEDVERVRAVLVDRLRPDWRRLVGPGLILLGIIVGTVANLAAP